METKYFTITALNKAIKNMINAVLDSIYHEDNKNE